MNGAAGPVTADLTPAIAADVAAPTRCIPAAAITSAVSVMLVPSSAAPPGAAPRTGSVSGAPAARCCSATL